MWASCPPQNSHRPEILSLDEPTKARTEFRGQRQNCELTSDWMCSDVEAATATRDCCKNIAKWLRKKKKKRKNKTLRFKRKESIDGASELGPSSGSSSISANFCAAPWDPMPTRLTLPLSTRPASRSPRPLPWHPAGTRTPTPTPVRLRVDGRVSANQTCDANSSKAVWGKRATWLHFARHISLIVAGRVRMLVRLQLGCCFVAQHPVHTKKQMASSAWIDILVVIVCRMPSIYKQALSWTHALDKHSCKAGRTSSCSSPALC